MALSVSDSELVTLSIDIGGQGIKALAIVGVGQPRGERTRIKTPRPAKPDAVIKTIEKLIKKCRPFDQVALGFPGVISGGVVRTAPNLDGKWDGVLLEKIVGEIAGVPTRAINDADMQGFGAIEGEGVELVITLGTGVGSALFLDGRLLQNLELGHHPFEKEQTYEERLGQAALDGLSMTAWTRRVTRAIDLMRRTFNFRKLYIGGGNARLLDPKMADDVTTVPNSIAFLGGAKLWHFEKPVPISEPSTRPSTDSTQAVLS